MSILVGGGQDYYGPTAERDKVVVSITASLLRAQDLSIQIVTGGTAGVPDDFARAYHPGPVVDIVSSEYLETYKDRTKDRQRPYWVAGETQEKRRLAFLSNPDIRVGLFIQGGQYTAHEIKLFQESGRPVVVFTGSGGACGGKLDYKGWRYTPAKRPTRAYDSEDPDANPFGIARDLVEDVMAMWKK